MTLILATGRPRPCLARAKKRRGRFAGFFRVAIILFTVPSIPGLAAHRSGILCLSQEQAAPPSRTFTETNGSSLSLEEKIESVTAREVDAFAKAFGFSIVIENPPGGGEGRPLYEGSQLRALGTIHGTRDPQCVLYLSGHAAGEGGQPVAEDWVLEFVTWDGTHWRGSSLDQVLPSEFLPADWKSHTQPLGVEIISHSSSEEMLALVLYDVPNASVFPLVFRIADHAASLIWDSRSDDSRYEPLSGGRVAFNQLGTGIPSMVVSGKADPGLLVFAPRGRRGFEARTTYVWKENAYAPSGTEYEANEDFRLYEFVSALHLHNYNAAYALIDPARFLKSDKPSLDAFRDLIQQSWSEFLDDHIFAATQTPNADGNGHAFELDEGGKKTNYLPTFSPGPKFLLTGLMRQEE